jgi:sulfur carrier protein ThiS
LRVTLKLFASLTDYLPAGSLNNRVDLDVGESDSVADIIERFSLPQKLVHLVLVNGVYLSPFERPTRRLKAGDQLAVWPPIAGG